METNEQIRRALSKALEEELESFLAQVSQMTEGELKHLEEQVVKSSQAIGRKLMEGVLTSRLHERRPVARREGEVQACATAGGRTSQGTDYAGRPGQFCASVLSMPAWWRGRSEARLHPWRSAC